MSVSILLIPAALILAEVISKDELKEMSQNKQSLSTIRTTFKDMDILKDALECYGANIKSFNKNSLICNVENIDMEFTKAAQNGIILSVKGKEENIDELHRHIKLIDEEYKYNMQEYTYSMLKEKLKENNKLTLESEQVMEDDSIVLTLNINE
ncbi:hypothetical protein [Clostridium peptidivorans]|uniref:hypothetical protein n=1 Tax=Clostridium peptidivorans TaxID=100174 RepID=UPI000BE35221|nr:hypothetical protein [Clostridium peptidivorans]